MIGEAFEPILKSGKDELELIFLHWPWFPKRLQKNGQ
jgi:hypothetical protein